MIGFLHRLRRDEEGQTLVLGAVFGIVLALCVMGTVNLGRAVYQKIQLQTACDNGAYSQAAVEARTMNLIAYTNRAMVVHYSSMMAMSAYLTWLHFTYAWVSALLTAAEAIPGIGEVVAGLVDVLQTLLEILDYAVGFITPIVSAANFVLWALQEGAWGSVYLSLIANNRPEAHSGDSSSAPYANVGGALLPLANATVFSQVRGGTNLTPATAITQSLEILLNNSSPVVQEARLHMLEVANSAREPWVAYGDHYSGNTSLLPIARHWGWTLSFLCSMHLGVNAQTQLGSWAPGAGLAGFLNGDYLNTTGEIFSASRAWGSINCLGFSATVDIFSLATVDQLLGFTGLTKEHVYNGFQWVKKPGGFFGGLAAGVMQAAISPLSNAAVAFANNASKIQDDYRPMWISPYVYFSPSKKAGPAGGAFAVGPGLGNFGQPDVVFGLAAARNDFNKAPAGNANAFLNQRPIGSIIAGQSGQVDFSYNGNDWPQIPGLPAFMQLQAGFNTLCAAQAYYHRPGDWKEMPNFFNPLWAARLMPVAESNAAAVLGTNQVPLVKNLLLH